MGANTLEDIGMSSRKLPASYDLLFTINSKGAGFILHAEDTLYDIELLDGHSLDDNLTTRVNVPLEIGVYSCKLHADAFRCNHHEDPEEWDMSVWIDDVKKLMSFDI